MKPEELDALAADAGKRPETRLFLRAAEAHRKAGHFRQAVGLCEEGLSHHPDDFPALVCLGRSLEQLGDYEKAESTYRSVITFAPDNPHALAGLERMLSDQGREQEALPFAEALLLLQPNDEELAARVAKMRGEAPKPSSTNDVLSDRLYSSDKFRAEEAFATTNLIAPILPPENDEEDEDETDILLLQDEVGDVLLEESLPAIDEIDLEFARALHEIDEEPAALFVDGEGRPEITTLDLDENEVNDEQEVKLPLLASGHLPEPGDPVEAWLTRGLKHEKQEHYEAALQIYRTLSKNNPNDYLVKEHLDRVNQLLAHESKRERKIRILSIWLDKIKGVYHVS